MPADELEKARALREGPLRPPAREPAGLILFGLRREVLEGAAAEPEEVLAGLDAVTVEDVQRVAQEIIGPRGLNLALIGPFDDAERFEKLLDSPAWRRSPGWPSARLSRQNSRSFA